MTGCLFVDIQTFYWLLGTHCSKKGHTSLSIPSILSPAIWNIFWPLVATKELLYVCPCCHIINMSHIIRNLSLLFSPLIGNRGAQPNCTSGILKKPGIGRRKERNENWDGNLIFPYSNFFLQFQCCYANVQLCNEVSCVNKLDCACFLMRCYYFDWLNSSAWQTIPIDCAKSRGKRFPS